MIISPKKIGLISIICKCKSTNKFFDCFTRAKNISNSLLMFYIILYEGFKVGQKMSAAWLLIGLIRIALIVWDFVTFPVYVLIQTPWRKQVTRVFFINRLFSGKKSSEPTNCPSPLGKNVKKIYNQFLCQLNLTLFFKLTVQKRNKLTCLDGYYKELQGLIG